MVLVFINSLIIVVVINILAYIWAYKKQSDHLTDISYSACFVGLAWILFLFNADQNLINFTLLMMVSLWGLRLGGFLFYRIKKIGKDKRFNEFRGSWKGFLKFFLLQGISIWIISLPIIIAFTNDSGTSFSVAGLIIWLVGWSLETLADHQKFKFKQQHPDSFYDGGLFKKIRHPNYLGEILVWIGIFVYTIPMLDGWQWIGILSPIWIILLLLKISGIPLLEDKAWKKYGNDPAFIKYLENSWRLIPGLY